jgi:hypothetical protein
VKDVVVAVPTKMYASNLAPYGDGQRNSIPTFGGWKITERPPVIATLIDFTNAPRRVLLRFDRALNITANAIEIVYYVNGTKRLADVAATKTPPGDLEAEWSVPDEVGFGLLSDAAVAIHPKGWNDWFPLWFRMPVKTVAQMHASATKFADGKSIIDREGVGFKVMYTCFEGRRPDLEASAPQGGVASGGGWHLIGDPAETIVNDLEAGPLVVAAATTTPFSANGLPGGGFAYGITDVRDRPLALSRRGLRGAARRQRPRQLPLVLLPRREERLHRGARQRGRGPHQLRALATSRAREITSSGRGRPTR